MVYNFNNKSIAIPDVEIKKYMEDLQITKEEAIGLWLDDNDYTENEEQNELDTKAKQVKIQHGAGSLKKDKKPYVRKISDEKVVLFIELKNWLDTLCKDNDFKYEVLKENKLVSLTAASGTQFKIDLIETRKKK